MTESSLSTLEIGDPWNTPSVMAITPPLYRRKIDKEIMPPGSSELQRIITEMYEELEIEKRIKMCDYSNTNSEMIRKGNQYGTNSKALSGIPIRIECSCKPTVGKKKKTVSISE